MPRDTNSSECDGSGGGRSNSPEREIPDRACVTPVERRGLEPFQSNYPRSLDPERSPEREPILNRERSTNNRQIAGEERTSERERSYSNRGSSGIQRSQRGSRHDTEKSSYPRAGGGANNDDDLPPPYTTNLPSTGSGSRIPIVLRPWNDSQPARRGNRTPPMVHDTIPFRRRTRDTRIHNTPPFIPYADPRDNPNFNFSPTLRQVRTMPNLNYPIPRRHASFSHHSAFSHPRARIMNQFPPVPERRPRYRRSPRRPRSPIPPMPPMPPIRRRSSDWSSWSSSESGKCNDNRRCVIQ
jgi:hypothetical protein